MRRTNNRADFYALLARALDPLILRRTAALIYFIGLVFVAEYFIAIAVAEA